MSSDVTSRSPPPSAGYLSRFSGSIVGQLQSAFFSYGKTIAQRPGYFILFCLVFTALCCIGFVRFTQETDPYKLWTPEGSEFFEVVQWQQENIPSDIRLSLAIWEADNVLEKQVLLEMLRVHKIVADMRSNLTTWENVCFKVPILSFSMFGRRKRDIRVLVNPATNHSLSNNKPLLQPVMRKTREVSNNDDDDIGIDWSLYMSRERYCGYLASMEQACFERSILEVFGYDYDLISSLTQDEIISDINTVDTSAITGFPINVSELLGNVEKDADGQIIKAGASKHTWVIKVNRTAIEQGQYVYDLGEGSKLDTASYEWEQSFVENALNDTERPENISIYLMASTSFGIVSKTNVENDLQYLALSFGTAFIYILVMLGKFNRVEQRPALSVLGLLCVGLAVGVSYGICSMCNVTYGPVNNILPFLLLGLGIDDMFVIMQAWNNLTPTERQLGLPQRIGCALKHAGVSITVTSVTDFAAFAIGCTTKLPALRAFCIYAAVGIASIYFFQATFLLLVFL